MLWPAHIEKSSIKQIKVSNDIMYSFLLYLKTPVWSYWMLCLQLLKSEGNSLNMETGNVISGQQTFID